MATKVSFGCHARRKGHHFYLEMRILAQWLRRLCGNLPHSRRSHMAKIRISTDVILSSHLYFSFNSRTSIWLMCGFSSSPLLHGLLSSWHTHETHHRSMESQIPVRTIAHASCETSRQQQRSDFLPFIFAPHGPPITKSVVFTSHLEKSPAGHDIFMLL